MTHRMQKSLVQFLGTCARYSFVNEPFTETKEKRRVGRRISRSVMLRVVRRDNNQCQICGCILRDNEIELDHIIPVSKGGSSEEHNVRVTCLDCNRNKGGHVDLTKPVPNE